MKRVLILIGIVLSLLSSEVNATDFYPVTAATGGAAGALDNKDGAGLSEGDGAILIMSSGACIYRLDATADCGSDSSESPCPRSVIPDSNPGTKCWELALFAADSVSVPGSTTPGVTLNDSDDAAGTAYVYGNSSGGANDVIMSLGVEDSGGEDQTYIEVDGVSETVDIQEEAHFENNAAAATFGAVGTDADVVVAFDAVTSQGSMTYMEDEDRFDFDNDVDVIADFTAGTVASDGAVSGTEGTFTGNVTGLLSLEPDADGETILTAECRGSIWENAGANTYVLPGAAAGLNCCFYAEDDNVITIDPADGTDTIYLDGDTVGAGDTIESSGDTGEFICMYATDATNWRTLGKSGTWADSNP